MKNSIDTIWDRTSDLPICSAAPLPLCYRGPRCHYSWYAMMWSCNLVYCSHLDSSVGWFRTKKKIYDLTKKRISFLRFWIPMFRGGKKTFSLFFLFPYLPVNRYWFQLGCLSERRPVVYFDMRILEKGLESPRLCFRIDCNLILLFHLNRIWFS